MPRPTRCAIRRDRDNLLYGKKKELIQVFIAFAGILRKISVSLWSRTINNQHLMELSAYKLELMREIINSFNNEVSLKKLAAACRQIRNEEECGQLPAMPAQLLEQLMDKALQENAEGKYITDNELEKEMQSW